MAHLELTDLQQRYGGHVVVNGVSFAVEAGSIACLLGPSGCGKTTLLRCIAGFEPVVAGEIRLEGRTVSRPGFSLAPEKRRIGMVFQDYALFPHLTIAGNVAFGLGGLADLAQRYPHELSGGQQQRVAIARALAPAPALLLLDEPFSNLDADLRGQMRDEIERILRRAGATAVVVTHDQEEAFAIADAVGVLNHGRLEQIGPAEELYHRPATPFVAEFVGAADFIPGVVTADGIATEVGVFENADGWDVGRDVRVLIRPDDVVFIPRDDGDAVILRRYFRGSENLYCLGLPSGHRIHSTQPSSTGLASGTRVRATVTILHLVTFAAD